MKKDLSLAVMAALIVAGICYGLATFRPQSPPISSRPVGAASSISEYIVMRVNGEPVSEREFAAFVEQAPEDRRDFYASPAGRDLLAVELVKLKALEQEARRLGADTDPSVVSRVKLIRSNLMAEYALRKLVPAPDEARIRQEYEKQKKNLEAVEVQHILVSYQGSQITARDNRPRPLEAAMKKAQGIAARLRAGADFTRLARSESDDLNTANEGGRLGTIRQGTLPGELDAIVMNLKPGEISDPVRSSFGVHIFRAGQRKPMEMNDQVREGLAGMIQRKDLEAAVTRLENEAKVELDPKFFGKASLPKRAGT